MQASGANSDVVSTSDYEAQDYDVEKEYKLHPLAYQQGGLILHDANNVLTSGFKEVMAKIGSKLIKGQFHDMLKISAPAKVHSAQTLMQCNANDNSLCAFQL